MKSWNFLASAISFTSSFPLPCSFLSTFDGISIPNHLGLTPVRFRLTRVCFFFFSLIIGGGMIIFFTENYSLENFYIEFYIFILNEECLLKIFVISRYISIHIYQGIFISSCIWN